MAISRPFLLALLGVALLGATVFAVQNARNSASDDPAPVAKQAAPAQPASTPEPAKAEPLTAEQALASILEPGRPVDSAQVSFTYETQEVAGGREHDTLSVNGAFDDSDKGSALSDFDMSIRSRDELSAGKVDSAYDVRVMAVDGKGFVGSGDELHAVPAQITAGLDTIRTGLADSPIAELPEFQLTRWVEDAKVVGVEEVDGVDATHVTGNVAAGSVARDIVRVMAAEAATAGAEPDVPAATPRLANQAVKSARVDAWVGSDRILRRARLAVVFDAPKQLREPGDSARWTAEAELRLSEVNKTQSFDAPAAVAEGSAAKSLGAEDAEGAQNVFTVLGLGLDAPGGVVGTTFSFLSLNRLGDSNVVAKKVLRSVQGGNETLVFFRNPRALDDQATAESVSYLKAHTKKLAVFTDDVANAERYGRLLENLGVSQAPAIVFINRRGKASLVEGYVDGPSLAQVIADAR